MTCTSCPILPHRARLPLLLSTLSGAASAVHAPRPGEACCFRLITRPPSSRHRKTGANPDSTAGSIKNQAQRPYLGNLFVGIVSKSTINIK